MFSESKVERKMADVQLDNDYIGKKSEIWIFFLLCWNSDILFYLYLKLTLNQDIIDL